MFNSELLTICCDGRILFYAFTSLSADYSTESCRVFSEYMSASVREFTKENVIYRGLAVWWHCGTGSCFCRCEGQFEDSESSGTKQAINTEREQTGAQREPRLSSYAAADTAEALK